MRNVLALVVLLCPPVWARTRTSVVQPQQGSMFSPTEIEAAAQDPKRFTVNPASVEIVALGPSTEPRPGLPGLPPPPGGNDSGLDLDRIINLAKQVWQFIVDNKPVVDVVSNYANAVPHGLEHWSQLSDWSQPDGTVYGFYAKNLYGVRVVEVKYMVLRTHGGNYRGKGKYLNAVTVQPLSVEVAWGYRLNMSAEVPSVANVGTSEDPVASMILNAKWAISTVLKHAQGTSVYYVQGDGAFREIGGPFRNQALESATERLGALGGVKGLSLQLEGRSAPGR